MIKKVVLCFCLVILVVCLLLPASVFFKKTSEYVSGLQFSNITGFLWRGKLHQVSFLHRGYRMPVGDVSWKFNAKSLTRLALCIDFFVMSDDVNGDGHGCFSLINTHLEVDNFHVRVPVAEVAELSGIAIDGIFDAKVQYLLIENGHVKTLHSDIVWKKAAFNNGEKWLSLGELLFNISAPETNELSVHLHDIQSPIKIDVIASFYNKKIKSIVGTIDSQKVKDESWLSTLDLFSQRKEGSQYIFDRTFK